MQKGWRIALTESPKTVNSLGKESRNVDPKNSGPGPQHAALRITAGISCVARGGNVGQKGEKPQQGQEKKNRQEKKRTPGRSFAGAGGSAANVERRRCYANQRPIDESGGEKKKLVLALTLRSKKCPSRNAPRKQLSRMSFCPVLVGPSGQGRNSHHAKRRRVESGPDLAALRPAPWKKSCKGCKLERRARAKMVRTEGEASFPEGGDIGRRTGRREKTSNKKAIRESPLMKKVPMRIIPASLHSVSKSISDPKLRTLQRRGQEGKKTTRKTGLVGGKAWHKTSEVPALNLSPQSRQFSFPA